MAATPIGMAAIKNKSNVLYIMLYEIKRLLSILRSWGVFFVHTTQNHYITSF